MHSEIENRKGFVDELSSFITSAKKTFEEFAKNIGWNFSELMKVELKEPMVTCPYNPGHMIFHSTFDKHLSMCEWIHEGYSKEEKESSLPSSHFFYTNSMSVVPVLLDKTTQTNILKRAASKPESGIVIPNDDKSVPRTMDRAFYELNPQERLAIYEYVMAKAKETNKQNLVKIEDLQMSCEKKNDQNKREKTHLEILAEQRDYKRRRQSYRAKNVHITKKSYTEVMREVIQNQMEVFENLQKDEKQVLNADDEYFSHEFEHQHERCEKSSSPENTSTSHRRKQSHHSSRHKVHDYRHNELHSSFRDKHRHKHKRHKHKKSHRKSSSSEESSFL